MQSGKYYRTNVKSNLEPCPIIQFTYNHDYDQECIGEMEAERGRKISPEFLDSLGIFRMLVGQNAIVFLKLGSEKLDNKYDYIDTYLSSRSTYGPLFISSGSVHDVNRIWGSQEYVSYSVWKADMLTFLNNLINRTY